MEVVINDNSVQLPDGANVTDVLGHLKIISPSGIAVAVNEHVITQSNWSKVALNNGDRILIIQATQGG